MKNRFIIAGVDRTKDILLTQSNRPTIERRLRQEADCRFVVKSNPRPSEGEEIIIYNQDNAKLFAGIIDEVHDMELGQGIHILYSCKARDYTYQLNRKLVVETYENQSADVIVRDILTKYAPNFNGTFVESGAPVVEWITFDYKMPSECFQELCDYVGWYWYVDYDKAIHFFNPQELPEPAPMIIQPGGDFRNFRRSIDIVGLRNRVYVRGGSMLSDFQPVRWKADGVARIWTLPWPPHEISFKVGEVSKTVGVENLHEESEYDYMMSFSEKYIRCSSHTSTPVEGITMELTAKQDIPVITMVEDYASQAAVKAVQGGDGIYEHVIVDDTLTSIVAAEAAGTADLREHANPRVKGSFETEFSTPPEIVERLIDEAAVFTRDSKAYLSDGTEVAAGAPRFEQGKFDRAVLVEEGTTNLVDFDIDFRAWSSNNSNMASLTTKTGRHSFQVKGTSTVPGAYSYIYPAYATTNVLHSAFAWVRNLNSKPLEVRLRIRDGFNGESLSDNVVVVVPPGQELPIRVTSYSPVSLNQVTVAWSVYSDPDDGTVDAEIYMCQLEAKPYPTSFTPSTRSPETLTIPTAGVLNPQEGAVAFWYKMGRSGSIAPSGKHDNFFGLDSKLWSIYQGNGIENELRFRAGDSWDEPNIQIAVNWDEGDILFIVARWKLPDIYLDVWNYTKGTYAFGSATGVTYTGSPTLAYVNCGFGSFTGYNNGLIDDLAIFDYAPTDEEIQAWYEADAPIPITEHTTLKMPFNNSLDASGSKIVYTHWQPGQLVTINLPDRGIEGEYLIQRVTASPLTSKLWTFRVEFGGRLLGIEDFLQALVSAYQKKRYIEPTKNVQKYIYVDETLQVSDALSTATKVLPFICGDPDAICGMVVVSNG